MTLPYVRRGDGPIPAQIMLVGEAFGEREEMKGLPFEGPSGELLNGMLHDAGIMRSECYITNLVNARPPYNDLTKWIPTKKGDITPQHVSVRNKMALPIVKAGYENLWREVAEVKPNIIIAFGNWAMWALTGETGILKWRGSEMALVDGTKIIPTIHPAAILREYSLRQVALLDLRRAARERATRGWAPPPPQNFIIAPSFRQVLDTLTSLQARVEAAPTWIEFDLETSPRHITCVGLSWSLSEAICIPITSNGRGFGHYWAPDEEGSIIYLLYKLLTHPNCWVRGQNLLYDCQHTYRWWHFIPNVKQDTMISHHSCFSGLKKSLAFQSSMYCSRYRFWKDDHKDESNKAGS